MFDRNETHNSRGKQAFHSVFERSGYRFACRKRVKSKTLRLFRTRRRPAPAWKWLMAPRRSGINCRCKPHSGVVTHEPGQPYAAERRNLGHHQGRRRGIMFPQKCRRPRTALAGRTCMAAPFTPVVSDRRPPEGRPTPASGKDLPDDHSTVLRAIFDFPGFGGSRICASWFLCDEPRYPRRAIHSHFAWTSPMR